MDRKNFNSEQENIENFNNFNFSDVKIGEQFLPFMNYNYEGNSTNPYLWNKVDVIAKTNDGDPLDAIVIMDENGNCSPWYFNDNDGFKIVNEEEETIGAAFKAENAMPRKFPKELKALENYTFEHIDELCYEK